MNAEITLPTQAALDAMIGTLKRELPARCSCGSKRILPEAHPDWCEYRGIAENVIKEAKQGG